MLAHMAVTQSDFDEAFLEVSRTIRTPTSESYLIYSSDSDMGETYDPRRTMVGRISLHYTTEPLKRNYISGIMYLHEDWEEEALSSLVGFVDERIVSMIGVGSRQSRESFDVHVIIAKDVYHFGDKMENDKRRGLPGIFKKIDETQELIKSIPDSISEEQDT